MIGTQHKRYNPLIPLSLSATCLFGSIQAHASTLLFEDTFDGTTLNSAWIVSSSTAANSRPSVANGILTLAQNSTDAGPTVTRKFTPTKKMRLELRHMQHAASDYYLPVISMENGTKYIGVQFHKSAWSGDNCDHSEWYNKIKISGGMIEGSVSCGNGDYLAAFAPLTTSSYLDRWLTTIIDYDADTGDFSLDIDGDGVVDYRATIKADSRGVAFENLVINAYGWYTGHWAKIDYVKVYDMSAAGVCSAPTEPNTGVGVGSTIQNETEDNGSIANANTIRADGSTVYASWYSAGTDVDLYKFTTTQADTFDLELKANANAGEVRFELSTENAGEGHRSLHTEIFSLTANTAKRISIPLDTAQTYYLNLRGWTVTANTRYEFTLKPRSTTGTATGTTPGTSGTYDQGYSAGAAAAKAACLANPASCGITTSGAVSSIGHASYDPLTGTVRIPYLDVPNVFGSPFVYSLDLNIINASPLRFELKTVRQVQ